MKKLLKEAREVIDGGDGEELSCPKCHEPLA